MKSRKELLREYRDRSKPAGVYRIKNRVTGRAFLGSSLDLDGRLESHRFRLEAGLHPNGALQRDWKELGPDAFSFEILETVTADEARGDLLEGELSLLEEIWLERLKAEGAEAYNTDTNLRRP